MSNGTNYTCPPNDDDDILSTGANIMAILTFIYALGAGVLVYTQSIRDSTRKMEETIRDLQFSHNEFQAMKLSFSAVRCKMDNSTDEQVLILGKTFLEAAHDFDRRLRELMGTGAWIDKSLDRTPTSLLRLRDRNKFALKQVNYANMTGDKDRAMESLRRAKERSEANPFSDFNMGPVAN